MALVAILTAVGGKFTDIGPSVASLQSRPVAETSAGYLRPPVLLSTVPSVLARHQAEVQAIATPSRAAAQAAATAAAAAPQDTPEVTQAPLPAYFTYTIQPGDTISSIAARFGIAEDYLIWNNGHVASDPDSLIIGATLVVPGTDGLVYNVTLGDTLNGIAGYYGIGVDSIIGYGPNGVSTPDTVVEGMVLVLPGAVPPAPIIVEPEPAPDPDPVPVGVSPDPEPYYPPVASIGYIWPFYASISTYYGWGHLAIDIDGFGNYGASIVAAASGTVVLVAWDSYGYGYHVIIAHDDGSQTLYAHLSDIWVSQGEYVGQGQSIGALGSTGYSTGPHLHFGLYIGGVPVDPLAYLP